LSSKAAKVEKSLTEKELRERRRDKGLVMLKTPESTRLKLRRKHGSPERSERGRESWKQTESVGKRTRDSGGRIKRRRGSRRRRN